MDEMTTFERQVAGELDHMAGPGRRVDVTAMVRTVATPSSRGSLTTRWRRGRDSAPPTERGYSMFSAVKLAAAGVIVALFGGFLLAGVPTSPQEVPVPAAESVSAEPTYEPPVPVTGTVNEDAEGVEWAPAMAGADVVQEVDRMTNRGGGFTWTVETDDPRLNGTAYGLKNLDMIGPRYEYHQGETFTGTLELVSAEGSWLGSLRGYATMGPATRHWHIELTGTGGYDGLSALLEGVGPFGSAEIQGLIFPGALPRYPDPVDVSAE